MTQALPFPYKALFSEWLSSAKQFDAKTVSSRLSNLETINAYYPLLQHWDTDKLNSVLNALTYTQQDQANNKANNSKITISGDLYNGLATYKSALKLYIEFLSQHLIPQSFEHVIPKLLDALNDVKHQCRNKTIRKKNLDVLVIKPLLELLNSKLGHLGYKFNEEVNAFLSTRRKYKSKKPKDSYDIFGKCKNYPNIIIEFDTHRSDQITKKAVSRLAINATKEAIYVAVIYPNDHKSKTAEKKECDKYCCYLETLFTMFASPYKKFINYKLY